MKSLIILVSVLLLLSACSSSQYPKEKTDALATCLSEKGVKEYGAFWCPNCANQKKLFGDNFSIIMNTGVYVECDPRGENEQAELCIGKKIEKYPTWEFKNGEVIIGIMQLQELAAKAGCDF